MRGFSSQRRLDDALECITEVSNNEADQGRIRVLRPPPGADASRRARAAVGPSGCADASRPARPSAAPQRKRWQGTIGPSQASKATDASHDSRARITALVEKFDGTRTALKRVDLIIERIIPHALTTLDQVRRGGSGHEPHRCEGACKGIPSRGTTSPAWASIPGTECNHQFFQDRCYHRRKKPQNKDASPTVRKWVDKGPGAGHPVQDVSDRSPPPRTPDRILSCIGRGDLIALPALRGGSLVRRLHVLHRLSNNTHFITKSATMRSRASTTSSIDLARTTSQPDPLPLGRAECATASGRRCRRSIAPRFVLEQQHWRTAVRRSRHRSGSAAARWRHWRSIHFNQ